MRLGVLVRGDRRGLAIQSAEVARHIRPAKLLGIDMGGLSPYPNEWSDLPASMLTVVPLDKLTLEFAEKWLDGLDVVWAAETFYKPWWTGLCKKMGMATVLAPNPEFASHVYSEEWAPLPDALTAATRWRIGEMPGATYLPHGVCRHRLPFRQRTKADTFLFVLGHHATRDRQGIRVLWDALARVTEPIRVIVRSQRDVNPPHQYPSHIDLDIRVADEPDYAALYSEGDVFVHPRRYGGLSLPLLEAMSVGMVPLATDASPQKSWLPPEMLLACTSDRVWRSLVGELALHDVMPAVLAQRINELAQDPGEVARLSLMADSIAERFSWAALEPQWRALFESLAESGEYADGAVTVDP